jgi:outer membrane lipoprotein-sorting protein
MRFVMSKTTACLAGFLLAALASSAQAQTAHDIVVNADKARNPDKPFHITATLIDYKAGKPIGRNVYSVYSKVDPATGQFRDVMLYVDPPRDAGKVLLLNGRNLWFYDPASRESVRISPQQKLSGQASAGDVLTENLAVDYTPQLVGSETIEDGGRRQRTCWRLALKAANDGAAYNHVDYWVEKETYTPIKAELYADSGALLKILYYRNFVVRDGRNQPTQSVIIDAVDRTLVTTADFGELQFQDLPDTWFNREYLPHLKLK